MSRMWTESAPGRRDRALGLKGSGAVVKKFVYYERNAGKKHDFYIQ